VTSVVKHKFHKCSRMPISELLRWKGSKTSLGKGSSFDGKSEIESR
jgi:hypothetical protein